MPDIDLTRQPSTKALDATVGAGGLRAETEYAAYWQAAGVVLKGKYRPSTGSIPQWRSADNGRAGKAKTKVSHKGQQPPVPMVLVVNGGTGKRRLVTAESLGL